MTWTILVRDFGRMFCQVAGNPKVIDLARFRRSFVIFSHEDLGRWPQLWQAFGQSLSTGHMILSMQVARLLRRQPVLLYAA